MGVCCSTDLNIAGAVASDGRNAIFGYDADDEDIRIDGGGCLVRQRGFSRYISMAIKQGRKEVNQDAMTVWEGFGGKEDMFYCGVYDGHGPLGHKIARYVRDRLPWKINSYLKDYVFSDIDEDQFFRRLKAITIMAFKEVDEELGAKFAYDSFCSGTTAVVVIKKGDRLMMANLGDSRAVLCSRGSRNQTQPDQLTIDMKPNVPNESQRIRSCKGRVFAMDNEPEVYRVWMPDDNCPGLAMSRAFGDFCLKDYGLISIPDISYRNITDKEEFVVLATDGIWDVLTNHEVVKIVGSASSRATAAETLIQVASQTWRTKYSISRADDCAVVCLFLKEQMGSLSKSLSRVSWEMRPHSYLSGRSKSKGEQYRGDDERSVSEIARVYSRGRLSHIARSLSLRWSRRNVESVQV